MSVCLIVMFRVTSHLSCCIFRIPAVPYALFVFALNSYKIIFAGIGRRIILDMYFCFL
jgi:hypothetical protein